MGVTIKRNTKFVKTNPLYSFDKKNGYFGVHKPGNKKNVRTIYTDGDPMKKAKNLFGLLTRGGEIKVIVQNHMWGCNLADGTYVTLRIDHPPGHAPAVELSTRKSSDPAGIVGQKIHFEKKGK